MAVTLKETPRLVRPAGSHWLTPDQGPRSQQFGPFSKEELYPILELEVPRVGLVRATFNCDRYVHSSGWSEWRIWLKDVDTPDPERPDLPYLGRPAAGVGEATRKAIREACEPLIVAWLETDAYRESRRTAAFHAAKQALDVPADYKIREARDTVLRMENELGGELADKLMEAVDLIDRARAIIDGARGD